MFSRKFKPLAEYSARDFFSQLFNSTFLCRIRNVLNVPVFIRGGALGRNACCDLWASNEALYLCVCELSAMQGSKAMACEQMP
ncbi:hypothetical protein [Pseudomonas sp. FEN]|nr:hypothetical protein [Pseudomonas sp. FEN]